MGWVTLTLRKTELKRTHADYQMQLLGISREKRQMARSYHYQQTLVQNDMNDELRSIRSTFDEAKTNAREGMNNARGNGETDVNGEPVEDFDQEAYDQAQQDYQDAKERYERETNDAKQMWEDELAMIEEEANDTETMLDQEQVQIEAQLEAISAEIESVGEAVSSQIQASTIKLS